MGWREDEKRVKSRSGSNAQAKRDVDAVAKEAKKIFGRKIAKENDRRKK